MKMTLICLLPPPTFSAASTSGNDKPRGEIAPSDKPPILKKSRRLIAIAITLGDMKYLRKPQRTGDEPSTSELFLQHRIDGLVGDLAHLIGEIVRIIRVLDDEVGLVAKQLVDGSGSLGADIDALPSEI